MKTIRIQLFIAAALFAGVAIGFFASEKSAPGSETPAAGGEYVPKAQVDDRGAEASLSALRRRIVDLERELAGYLQSGGLTEADVSNAIARAAAKMGPQGTARPKSPREWMEEMKKKDPARFARMTNHFARMRAHRSARARSAAEFLASVDTSRMGAGAKKTHDELQELLAKREEIEEQLHQEDITDAQRHQLMDQMRQTDRAMRQLNRQERSNLIEETAKSLGFEGEAVKEISTTIQEVIEATDGDRGPPGGMPPPPGGPGGP